MWSSCPQQYKLSYIDGLSQSTSNIHSVFGSAMHETLQEYLSRCLRISKSQADKGMDTKAFLKEKMREIFLKESNEGKDPICTKEELVEFLEDGNLILDYFQKSKNFNNFFSLKYDELVAIEQPINTKIREHINFLGFIDLVVRSTFDGKYRIIDFKTSTSGWSKYQKKDPTKNAQILLYKKFYSEMLGVSMDMIDVEFIILKRKVSDKTDYVIPRISRHVPANGKPSINKAWNEFNTFVDNVFNPDGTYRTDVQFPKKPSKLCGWCEFYGTHCDGK
jgi:ATP-dependent exoDNAse (exonuclease V) beta subunit